MRVSVFVDGGHLRVLAHKAGHKYDPDFIEKVAKASVEPNEEPLRFLYYDCAPYAGKVRLPVSNGEHEFTGSDKWLRDLASKDLFAIRRGVLKFRGWKPKATPIGGKALADSDFKPDFEQKGVDMRIGLDIANHATNRLVDRLILITGDTDCIPAMKHARVNGLQVVLVAFPNSIKTPELLWHTDFSRSIGWPT